LCFEILFGDLKLRLKGARLDIVQSDFRDSISQLASKPVR
jgi:hypothetical protein